MKENMMNDAHKATNETYRNNYDRIFGYKDSDHQEDVEDGNNGTDSN